MSLYLLKNTIIFGVTSKSKIAIIVAVIKSGARNAYYEHYIVSIQATPL